ncbi:hypothetical protein R6Q57_016603, partial [Mikania cordata]
SGIAPVADATSSQSRADLLTIGLAVTNILAGLVWLSIRPKSISVVPPRGVQCERIHSNIPDVVASELTWAWESLSTVTCCRSLVIVYDGICVLQIGYASASSYYEGEHAMVVDSNKLMQGSIYQGVIKSGSQNYLANLSLYPGKSELPFLPLNTQAVILQPLGDKGIAILGGDTIRGFTRSDQLQGFTPVASNSPAPVHLRPSPAISTLRRHPLIFAGPSIADGGDHHNMFPATLIILSILSFSIPSFSSHQPPQSNSDVYIIGSGTAGSFVAHFLRKYSPATTTKIRIFYRHPAVLGRMATITIPDETLEAGTSILHPKNYHALNFTHMLNLEINEPFASESSLSLGRCKFLFKTIDFDSKHQLVQYIISLANSIRMLFRYGISLMK